MVPKRGGFQGSFKKEKVHEGAFPKGSTCTSFLFLPKEQDELSSLKWGNHKYWRKQPILILTPHPICSLFVGPIVRLIVGLTHDILST